MQLKQFLIYIMCLINLFVSVSGRKLPTKWDLSLGLGSCLATKTITIKAIMIPTLKQVL